ATLNSGDFTAGKLNTAGQEKLRLMLLGHASDQPAVVYLNLAAKDPMADAHRDSVRQYAQQISYSGQLELKDGANPATLHPAAPALVQLQKTDSNYRSSGGYGAASSNTAGMTQAGSSSSK